MRRFAVFVSLAAAAAFAQVSSPDYAVGRAGPAYSTAPGGYVLASLSEIQGSNFLAQYNPFGLNLANGQETMQGNFCALLAVSEGILAYGPASNITLLAPFDSDGNAQTGSSLQSPIWFGVSQGGMLGPINSSLQQSLFAEPASSACSHSAYWGIYRVATFSFGRTGSNYPTPPMSHGELASLADLKSSSFVFEYNGQGLPPLSYSSGDANGCCAVKLKEGFLTYGTGVNRSFVVPHYAGTDGTSACSGSGFASMDGVQRFATRWGNNPREFLQYLNFTTLEGFGTSFDGPSECDNQPSNAFAVLKSPPLNHSHGLGDCFEIELRAGYYTPDTGSCLADRWRYHTYNDSTADIPLTDFNTCGGTITAHQFSISTFNQQYAEVSVSALDSCSGCSASNKLIPWANGNQMNTVCRVTVGEFGWCELLVQIDKNYNCPTRSPPAHP